MEELRQGCFQGAHIGEDSCEDRGCPCGSLAAPARCSTRPPSTWHCWTNLAVPMQDVLGIFCVIKSVWNTVYDVLSVFKGVRDSSVMNMNITMNLPHSPAQLISEKNHTPCSHLVGSPILLQRPGARAPRPGGRCRCGGRPG